jgi:hypothetical protein
MAELTGPTLLVVGLGSIGTEVARLAKAFGMYVIAVNRSGGEPATLSARRRSHRSHSSQWTRLVNLRRLNAQNDISDRFEGNGQGANRRPAHLVPRRKVESSTDIGRPALEDGRRGK